MKQNLAPADIAVYVYQESSPLQRQERLEEAAAHYLAWRGLPCYGDFAVERRPGQKPFFPAQPDLRFSISHSGAYWLVAFHGWELGLDAQQHKNHAYKAIAKRWFHNDEYAAVQRYGKNCFFAVWSAKESLCKAKGQGIDASFARFCVVGPKGNILDICDGWQLYPFALAEGYSACLCAAQIGAVRILLK